jgi:uracil-DNA glycosylase
MPIEDRLHDTIVGLRTEIAACRVCAQYLPAGPRPVVQFGGSARVLIIGQAPGALVHTSGIPWMDRSGHRLREWTGIGESDFYDPCRVALVGMGFCYPGTGKSGDLPPRPECAPRWHERILSLLPKDRLTLLVGSYAQARYMPAGKQRSLTENVRGFREFGQALFPLPHPSWHNTAWVKNNDWFERDVLPALKSAVRKFLAGA